jgi:hypothetical protein
VVLALHASGVSLTLAFALHLLATFLSGWLPKGSPRLARSRTKRLLARVFAFCVPIVGAALAWRIRNHSAGTRRLEQERLASFHARFVESHTDAPVADPFTGSFDLDVSRISDAESFSAILDFGTPDHKRNALSRLAALGEPRHLRLLRACLSSPDAEVRLYAHAQLDSLDLEMSAALEAARLDHAEQPEDPALRAAYARQHAVMAQSGVFDDEISAWHAAQAKRLGGDNPWGAPKQQASAAKASAAEYSLESQAEAAYAARDFELLHEISEAMRLAGNEPPVWIDTCLEVRDAS